MGVAVDIAVEAKFVSPDWTDFTTDVLGKHGLDLSYGIRDNGPKNLLASSGDGRFVVNNLAGNSQSQQGAYSPAHASKRTGWGHGTPIRVVFTYGTQISVSSITRSGNTATVTTASAHGKATDDWVRIAGADQADYNGVWKITKTGASTYTFTVNNTPVTPATGTMTHDPAYVKLNGKAGLILPVAGQAESQQVDVTVYDGMRDLIATDVSEVNIQEVQTEDTVVGALLDALPSTKQPLYRDIGAGVDSLAYALDRIGGGIKCATAVNHVLQSTFAIGACKGDGTFWMRSRHARATSTSAYTFAGTMHDLKVPSSDSKVYNLIRMTVHRKTLDAAATSVLYAIAGVAPHVDPGTPLELFGTFRNEDDISELVGGLAPVTTLVSGTDYAGNSAEDGSGTDQSADLSIVATAWGTRVKFVVTNNGAARVYLVTSGGVTLLQIRGKRLRDIGPQTLEASTGDADKELKIDMKYQDDPYVGQGAADYLKAQFSSVTQQVEAVEFIANASDDFMTHALAREPGDRVTITEPVTGLTLVDVIIHRVSLFVTDGPWVRCKWGVAPAAPFVFWQWGTSEWGVSTVYGF